MSTIGDRGGSSSEALQQLKDQYGVRERESEDRHREEVAGIRKQHSAELDEVRHEADARIKDVQADANNKLNQKDIQNQKEIEALRAMYQRKITENKKT